MMLCSDVSVKGLGRSAAWREGALWRGLGWAFVGLAVMPSLVQDVRAGTPGPSSPGTLESPAAHPPPPGDQSSGPGAASLIDPREARLGEMRQLTFGGENAEAYWSPDGSTLIFQATPRSGGCDQIYAMRVDRPGEAFRISGGSGRTTCAYFTHDGRRVIYSSTHASSPDCPPPPDRSQGYVWPILSAYEIWSARPDGSDLRRLTENEAYDAEATVCPVDGSILFTSARDGDLDLYRMSADGADVKRLTTALGYDGGAFFSPDCKRIVWRASRPAEGAETEAYRSLLAQGLVRPSRLEIWVVQADGSDPRQVTYLGGASFAPFFFPSGERIIFSSNYGDPAGREFDLWAVNVDGSGLERITYTPQFDGFPIFSPDGKWLAFSSNRQQDRPHETNVFVARWRDAAAAAAESAADRFASDVKWLAADERGGRGVGTPGLEEAARWLAARFAELGLEPGAAADAYLQTFDAPVAVSAGPETALARGGEAVAADLYRPLGFSAASTAEGEVVFAGYGITAADEGWDDYKGLEVTGKIVVVRRFTPSSDPFTTENAKRRYSDLRYKTYNAREHGAAALLIADLPETAPGAQEEDEAILPALTVEEAGNAGIPVLAVKRGLAKELLSAPARVTVRVALDFERAPIHNVIGKLTASGPERLPGAILIGAHYDHLGLGGPRSLAPGVEAPHNGADDNASGVAGILEAARTLASRRADLKRDVYFVAFSAEEAGVIGSTMFTRRPPDGLAVGSLAAMFNLDMVGRLRENKVSVLGGESSPAWSEIVPPLCAAAGVQCSLGGDGYGPSDQTPFYAAGIPVLHFFTGAHHDYHKPSDDAGAINAAGGAKIAEVVAALTLEVAGRAERPAYRAGAAPAPRGDTRSYGASLGTIPDYVGPEGGRPGVLLAGVRAGSPAEAAGMRRGDILTRLSGREIRDVNDFVFVLRSAHPGETVEAVVERDGQVMSLEVTFGSRTTIR